MTETTGCGETGAPLTGATLLDGLAEVARTTPHRAAMILPSGPRGRRGRRGAGGYRATTFGQLAASSDAIAAGLAAMGIAEGARAALFVPPGEDFFALTFALLKAGAVPVLIDPGIGARHLRTCLAEATPAAFVGVPRAHAARAALRWAPSAGRLVVAGPPLPGARGLASVERDGLARIRGLAFAPTPRADTEVAAVLFTSGSTGVPKGVEYRHPQLAAQVQALRALYGLGPDDTSLATFPPFALFGPALGMTTVVPRMDPTRPADADPRSIAEAATVFGATVMFASPALLRTLASHGARTGARLPALRTVVSAGAPVPPGVVRGVTAMLGKGGQVVTPYGATEALPVTSIGSEELLALAADPMLVARGVCVGRAAPGVDVAVMRVDDGAVAALGRTDLLPDGDIGEVVVRGPVVTEAYHARPRETALAKTLWDGRTAHRMGDLGWLDGEGRLWFVGRKAQRVVTQSATLHTLPVEQLLTGHPAVARAALVGLGAAGRQRPVLCVELEPGQRWTPTLRAELLERCAVHPDASQVNEVLAHPRFPVDVRHNAKVGYDQLRTWAAGQLEHRQGGARRTRVAARLRARLPRG